MHHILRFILMGVLIGFFHSCMLTEDTLGIPSYQSVSGKKAKEEIGKATTEAVITGQLYWLARNGMQAGVGIAAPLTAINGFLVAFLQPLFSSIPNDQFYTEISLQECLNDIRGKGAFLYGLFLDSLPPGNAITASIRDGVIIPELASCDLDKRGKIIYIPPILNF